MCLAVADLRLESEIRSTRNEKTLSNDDTVDGRNPAPADRWLIPVFNNLQGFRHPRWWFLPSTVPISNLHVCVFLLPSIQRLNLQASPLCGEDDLVACDTFQRVLTPARILHVDFNCLFCSCSPPIYTRVFSYLVPQPRQFPAAFVTSTQHKAWKIT